MNKKRVNQWIAPAYKALEDVGIAVKGKIDPKFRGQISTFGAAVVMGSLKSAVAFFSKQGGAQVKRELLLSAMYHVITEGEKPREEPEKIFRYVCQNDNRETREKFTDAAIALKLAMNLFDMGKEDNSDEKSESAVQ